MKADAEGVTLLLPGRTQHLSHADVAALNNYDAQALGLPRHMAAMVVLAVEGRIDLPGFRITHSIEPFNHMQPWRVYRRVGALLWVGERVLRLNSIQLRALDAVAALEQAEDDIAARLRAWSALVAVLHVQGRHHLLVQDELPRLRITSVASFPAKAMTRVEKQLHLASEVPEAKWAMESGRRYYLRQNAAA